MLPASSQNQGLSGLGNGGSFAPLLPSPPRVVQDGRAVAAPHGFPKEDHHGLVKA